MKGQLVCRGSFSLNPRVRLIWAEVLWDPTEIQGNLGAVGFGGPHPWLSRGRPHLSWQGEG